MKRSTDSLLPYHILSLAAGSDECVVPSIIYFPHGRMVGMFSSVLNAGDTENGAHVAQTQEYCFKSDTIEQSES